MCQASGAVKLRARAWMQRTTPSRNSLWCSTASFGAQDSDRRSRAIAVTKALSSSENCSLPVGNRHRIALIRSAIGAELSSLLREYNKFEAICVTMDLVRRERLECPCRSLVRVSMTPVRPGLLEDNCVSTSGRNSSRLASRENCSSPIFELQTAASYA
jgi:hypothetical protein